MFIDNGDSLRLSIYCITINASCLGNNISAKMKITQNSISIFSSYQALTYYIAFIICLCTVSTVNVCSCSHLELCTSKLSLFISEVAAIPSNKHLTFLINGKRAFLLYISKFYFLSLSCLYHQSVNLITSNITIWRINFLNIISACTKRLRLCISIFICLHRINKCLTTAVRINTINSPSQMLSC